MTIPAPAIDPDDDDLVTAVCNLAHTEDGEMDVPTKVGCVDVLTKDQIIQVAPLAGWKAAMADVLANHHFHPDREMRVHLYRGPPAPDMVETVRHAYRIMDALDILMTCTEDILYGLFGTDPPPPGGKPETE